MTFGLSSDILELMRTIPREVCFEAIKKSFSLSQIQKSVLIGTILGDGKIQFRGNNCRLHIKHALKQLPLVEYKRNIFRNITSMGVRKFQQIVGEGVYNFAEFVTLTHAEFTKYYCLFYPFGKKIVPKKIGQLLVDPLSLAVWFMDDGSADYAGVSLNTHSFIKNDVERLIITIRCNFGIKTNKRINKGKWIIYFPKASLPKLEPIIGTYLPEEFKYKLIPYSVRKKQTP
ncbi:hypothetical protein FJZ41_00360 [Candidatus Shapirobacteria bacterium]|nr:hypothetical protein [Candidatus Shapirobacteria bacterium]